MNADPVRAAYAARLGIPDQAAADEAPAVQPAHTAPIESLHAGAAPLTYDSTPQDPVRAIWEHL